jgi:hypothetical protein
MNKRKYLHSAHVRPMLPLYPLSKQSEIIRLTVYVWLSSERQKFFQYLESSFPFVLTAETF